MKTYKDRIFLAIVIGWVGAGLTSTYLFGDMGMVVSGMCWILILCVLILFKFFNTKFGLWLETPIKK